MYKVLIVLIGSLNFDMAIPLHLYPSYSTCANACTRVEITFTCDIYLRVEYIKIALFHQKFSECVSLQVFVNKNLVSSEIMNKI